jgi:hypothetical protein
VEEGCEEISIVVAEETWTSARQATCARVGDLTERVGG